MPLRLCRSSMELGYWLSTPSKTMERDVTLCLLSNIGKRVISESNMKVLSNQKTELTFLCHKQTNKPTRPQGPQCQTNSFNAVFDLDRAC